MNDRTRTLNNLAEDLCVELNKNPVENAIMITTIFAKERKRLCRKTLRPTKSKTQTHSKTLEVWLDAFHFYIYFKGSDAAGKWSTEA